MPRTTPEVLTRQHLENVRKYQVDHVAIPLAEFEEDPNG
jgi:hypothetical protein